MVEIKLFISFCHYPLKEHLKLLKKKKKKKKVELHFIIIYQRAMMRLMCTYVNSLGLISAKLFIKLSMFWLFIFIFYFFFFYFFFFF